MTDQQEALLMALVEAARGLPGGRREPFTALATVASYDLSLQHPGLPGQEIEVYPADLEELAADGILIVHRQDEYGWHFDLSSQAYSRYSALKLKTGKPVERVEEPVRRYLSGDRFRIRHQEAQTKWEQAEALLWRSDSGLQLTAIGHHCREAMQAFGTSLLDRFPTEAAPTDPAATKARIAAVVQKHAKLGSRRDAFMMGLLGLWQAVVDLGQRQEHGAAKEGDPLTWEDGSRLVLYTALVMYELDQLLP
jgi:hypothetical protein